MSVSLYRYTEECEGKPCCEDCDKCRKDEKETEEQRQAVKWDD